MAAFTFDTFFDGTGTPCDASNQGDPVVLYDAQSGRWIITDFAWSNFINGPYYECIAVSKTGDPVGGGWWMYGFPADNSSHPYLNDYPKLGVWSDGIYMSANMFDILNANGVANYKGVRVWALNRADLVSGAPLTNVKIDLGSSYFGLLPSNYRGAQPPAGTPAFFASISGSTSNMRLWTFNVDWSNPAASSLTGPTNIPIASYSQPAGQVPQLGSSETLDTLGDRMMMQLQYRNLNGVESLWATHSVASGGVTGIRWYEIRNLDSSPSVYQQSTYQPDSTYRWMGSLAVDAVGNMAVGYSASSSSIYPAIRYAGRLASDPLNTLGQAETSLIAGGGAQDGGYSRWGDYSAMTVDPVDDCTFWYTTEYYETTGDNWQTRIGSFKYPTCTTGSAPGAFSKTTPADTATGLSTSPTLSWGAASGATGYEYCYDTTNDNACSTWTSSGASTSAGLSGLSLNTTYYWQVRATNSFGTTYADGSATTYWSFTTIQVSGVNLVITPATSSVGSGQVFNLAIEVNAGAQPVDGAAAYLNFNPAFLQVVSITAGNALPNIQQNSYDNTSGQVNFSAATLANFPSGTFTLATVAFKALAPTTGTALTFNTNSPRQSDVTFNGSSVLVGSTGGTVVISTANKISLPLLFR